MIDVGHISRQTAELSCIVYALKEIDERWRKLNDHIASLLVEDFMDPKTYTTLLFDDETFSRSRLYFWILGCLNEFNVSIEDNIKQWKLFRQARISRVLDPPSKSPSKSSPESSPESSPFTFDKSRDFTRLQELDKRAGEILRSLEDLQAQFKAKMAMVQALRDGVRDSSFSLSLPIKRRQPDTFKAFQR